MSRQSERTMSSHLGLLTAVLALMLSGSVLAQGARIIQWVENAPADDTDRIALGYPVPIPVDTPVPFDGFRSYAGLHTRHQDLANTSPYIEALAVGQTRAGRTIWAYRLGDANAVTRDGHPEQAMLTNGGIHAREWQTPEVVTGVMELLHDKREDHFLVEYLRDNVNTIVIPVLNIDGFMQTQRYPDASWMGTDINDPEFAPRDGRMRRKNMLLADEVMETQGDHLQGVDLNRNNSPFWNTSANSSSDNRSLIHHGQSAASEPEIQALHSAAELGPAAQLAMYTDVHSFSQVNLSVRNDNNRLANLTSSLLSTFAQHHQSLPGQKWYGFRSPTTAPRNQGIGTTDEYFTHFFQVPSWTMEVEPGSNTGAEYGGLGRNGHDGFILPESQIRRVRDNLAESFAVVYYKQAGPPSVSAVRIVDPATGALVFNAEWDYAGPGARNLFTHTVQPIQLGREYQAWVAFNKPMRWESNGQPVMLPGVPAGSGNVDGKLSVNGSALTIEASNQRWLENPGDSPDGYLHYKYDTLAFDFRLLLNSINQSAVVGEVDASLEISAFDMTGQRTDTDPSSQAHWSEGAWAGYEDSDGIVGADVGGTDKTISIPLTSNTEPAPFTVQPGTTSIWIDSRFDSQGFMLEILAGNRALVYWYTYNDQGNQDWYYAVGEIRGNRILFPELLQVENGGFGPGHDPAAVQNIVVGSASFTWTSCDLGVMDWKLENSDGLRSGRLELERLTRVLDLPCPADQANPEVPPPAFPGVLTGTWADPTHASEGFSLEVLDEERAVVFWFSYGPDSERRWFYNVGRIEGTKLIFDDLLTTQGPIFGEMNQQEVFQQNHWGEVVLDLGCSTGTATYSSVEEGFSSGTQNLNRITLMDGLECP